MYVSGTKKSIKEINKEAVHRTKRNLLSNQKGNVNIIIVRDKEVIDILETQRGEVASTSMLTLYQNQGDFSIKNIPLYLSIPQMNS